MERFGNLFEVSRAPFNHAADSRPFFSTPDNVWSI